MKVSVEKMQLATTAAKLYVEDLYAHRNVVSATKTVSVFPGETTTLVLNGDMHCEVESSLCIVFDVLYTNGNAIVRHQRIYAAD